MCGKMILLHDVKRCLTFAKEKVIACNVLESNITETLNKNVRRAIKAKFGI